MAGVQKSLLAYTQRSCNRLLRDRRSTAIRSSIVAHHFTIRTLVRVRNELRRRVETFACPEREIRLQSCADTSLRYFLSLIQQRPAVGLHEYCGSTSHQQSSVPCLAVCEETVRRFLGFESAMRLAFDAVRNLLDSFNGEMTRSHRAQQ